jgi:hypothetical protein
MGLDMFLYGVKHAGYDDREPLVDGFRRVQQVLELGYWRKHPDLHGYIVQNFAGGNDNCKPIDLNAEQLKLIRNAVYKNRLPHVEGFFFGESQERDRKPTLEILDRAIEWLEGRGAAAANGNEYRSAYYEASW